MLTAHTQTIFYLNSVVHCATANMCTHLSTNLFDIISFGCWKKTRKFRRIAVLWGWKQQDELNNTILTIRFKNQAINHEDPPLIMCAQNWISASGVHQLQFTQPFHILVFIVGFWGHQGQVGYTCYIALLHCSFKNHDHPIPYSQRLKKAVPGRILTSPPTCQVGGGLTNPLSWPKTTRNRLNMLGVFPATQPHPWREWSSNKSPPTPFSKTHPSSRGGPTHPQEVGSCRIKWIARAKAFNLTIFLNKKG